jgi:carbon monoxide dehydrogenase subunit G
MMNIRNYKTGLVAVATFCFVCMSCVTNVLTGQTVKEKRNTESFEGVALAFSGDVYISQGNTNSVEIEADKNILEIIESKVRDNTLVLKTRNGHWRNLGHVKVYITMPSIRNLSVSGSGDMRCETPVRTNALKVDISGSGSIHVQELNSPDVSAVITGSGDIFLAGSGSGNSHLKTVITGSGDFKAEDLPVEYVKVTITGSGSARVHALKELETNITGSGSVLYKGNPLVNANATGSGKTRSVN